MTRVVKIEKTGGPEVLKFEAVTLGKLGLDEVLIEHKAIGLNFIDIYHRSGLYPLELPSGIGGEASGIIKAIGSKVKDFSPGDKVAYAGAPLGAYSTERNYPIKNLVKMPDSVNFDIAATLMTKGLTTYYLLHKTYPVSANETILFHAAAGGVGQVFCQWAKSLGCKVIGTVGSDEKINIIAGKFGDTEGPVKGHNVEPVYFDVEIEKDKECNFNLFSTHNSFVYLIKGQIKIGDKNHKTVKNSTLILLTKGEKLKVKGITKSKFLLISGKPIGEPIARGGPFVMNTKQEILKAIQDYNTGNFVQK